MRVIVHGAAGGDVTGSSYLVECGPSRVLVDIGMFQGGREAETKNHLPHGLDLARLDAVLLTHAHLDHTGRLPLLIKGGYRGPVFMTAPTVDLTEIILKDSAKLQAQDILRINRKRERAGEPPAEPLYGPEHVEPFRGLARVVALNSPVNVAEGIRAEFLEAGHILGSASVRLTLTSGGVTRVLLFSGDLGPTTAPMLRTFEPPSSADVVFLESTYGDRDHRSYPETIAEFNEIVGKVALKHGKILVPTFAIGRAQQLLYHLAILFREGKVRPFPLYLDSPMAIEATQVFLRYPQLFDDEFVALRNSGTSPLQVGHFRPTVTAEESIQLNSIEGPCVILAGSGMCTGGRILHHLKQNLWKADTHVLMVGYQAVGSLGRLLIDGAQSVSIHGERIAVRGQIHTLGGFSAHAGQSDLVKWVSRLAGSRPKIFLTHGEDRPRHALGQKLRETFDLPCSLPNLGSVIDL